MKAADIMTRDIASAGADALIKEAARIMLDRGVSAVPVVDREGRIVGIVSEGDLMHRAELGTERRRSWWLQAFADRLPAPEDYVKAHARKVRDVMTREVVSVTEDTPVAAIIDLLEKHRIKRVPVVKEGRPVGIVSRADLLRALASALEAAAPAAGAAGDDVIRERVLDQLRSLPWWTGSQRDVIVTDGVAHLWGDAGSAQEADAIRVLVENIEGVRLVKSHLSVRRPGSASP